MPVIENTVLTPPAGFGWTPPILPIFKNGRWSGDKPARSLIPTPVGHAYYVDPIFGIDSNAGTPAAPLRTVFAALQKKDVGQVLLAPAPNVSLNDGAWGNPVVATSSPHVIVRPWTIRTGRPVVTNTWAHQEPDWAVDATNTKVYTASRSSVIGVIDMAGGLSGQPVCYVRAASIAECNTRPGSYYFSGGTVLSVNTINGAVPSPSLKVFIGTRCAVWASNKPLYVEGIDFVGGLNSFYVPDQSCDVVMMDCGAYCATGGNGFALRTSGTVVMERCRSNYHWGDAFNYHASATYGPGNVVEINCTADLSGFGPAENNQCSSAHDGIKIERIGCSYDGSEAELVADVTAGTEAWNVGLRLGSARGALFNAGYTARIATSWHYDCDFGSSRWSLVVVFGGEAYLDSSISSASLTGGGTIGAYVQT